MTRQHVYLSSNFWDGLWIIQQPICDQIQAHEPVLYVERFVSLFTILQYPKFWRRLFTWMRGARAVTSNLRVLAPLPLFHVGHRVPWLFGLEFQLQRYWIRWWARRGQQGPRILWVDNPLYEGCIARLGEDLAVYHVGDEVSAFPTSHSATEQALERKLLRKVDLVFAAAERLAEDKRAWHPRVHTIWNGIDEQAFQRDLPAAEFAEIQKIPEPRVAFVGVLDEWVDLELLVLAAKRLPHVHFLVVGPSNVEDRALRSLPNAHFLGHRDRVVVPGILRRCSASLVPFKKTQLTERIVPLKVFEALAAGVVPVCTDFSTDLNTLAMNGYALIGQSPAAFVGAVQKAVAADSAATRTRLSVFGRQQTWQARWAQMRNVLAERLAALRIGMDPLNGQSS